MTAAESLQKWLNSPDTGFNDPVDALSAFIESAEEDIRRYAAMPAARQGYINKRLDEIEKLRKIQGTLETLAPLEIWHHIGKTLQTQKDSEVDGVTLIIPLVINPKQSRFARIDLTKIV